MTLKLSRGQKIVLATSNPDKIKELRDLLAPYDIKTVTLGELGLKDAEESGASFQANAALKAKAVALASKLPALADDSGLSVRALGGQPGVFTARWAGPQKDYGHAMKKIQDELDRMEGHPDRRASFVCCLALSSPEGEVQTFEEKVDGELVWPIRGTNNMGFDPMFVPTGHRKTFGEMTLDEKQRISHRRQAFLKFVGDCIEL
jgi:XTP/dITP diphosphohydrolase